MSRLAGLGRQRFIHQIGLVHSTTNSQRAMFRGGVQSIAMANADVTLVVGKASSVQTALKSNTLAFDPEGVGVPDILLPAEADIKGDFIFVSNAGSAGEDIRFRDDADAKTVLTLGPGEMGMISCDGTNVVGFTGSIGGTDDFGASGIKADIVAESTASAGVTVDGVLIKDGGITLPDGSLLSRTGAGTGTGDVVERIGGTATEGLERRVFEGNVSPSAIETNVLLVPVNSRIESVQSNVEVTLVGGGTTNSFGIGTAADGDKYGSVAALTQNSKTNHMGDTTVAAAEQLVLTGTANETADGNTALTSGTVRIRIVYWTLVNLDNA